MIELPWPAKELAPNFRSRTHWARTRALKKARQDAFWATKSAKMSVAAGDVPVMLAVEFYPPDNRQRDIDNMQASCKAFYDGIADALGVNDHAFRFAVPIVMAPVKNGKVVVTIV